MGPRRRHLTTRRQSRVQTGPMLGIRDDRIGEVGDEFWERKLDGIETKVVGASPHPSPPRIDEPIAPICVRIHLRLLAAGITLEMFVGPDRAETEIVLVAVDQHLVGIDRSVEAPEHMIVERVRMIEREILDVAHVPGVKFSA